jgi:hypothetical protein
MLSVIAVVCINTLERPWVSVVRLWRQWLLWVRRLVALIFQRDWGSWIVLLTRWLLVVRVLLRVLVFFAVCAQQLRGRAVSRIVGLALYWPLLVKSLRLLLLQLLLELLLALGLFSLDRQSPSWL